MPRNSCKMLRDKQALIRLAGAAAALGCASIAAWYLTPATQGSSTSPVSSLLGGSATAVAPADEQGSVEPAPTAAETEAETAVDVAAGSSCQQASDRGASLDDQQGQTSAAAAAPVDTSNTAAEEDAVVAVAVVPEESVSTDSLQQQQQQHVSSQEQRVPQEEQHQCLQQAEASAKQAQIDQEWQEQRHGGQWQQLQAQPQEPSQQPQQQGQEQQQEQQQAQEQQPPQQHQKGQQQLQQQEQKQGQGHKQEQRLQEQQQGQEQRQQQQGPRLQASRFEQQLAHWQQRQQQLQDANDVIFTRSPCKQQLQQQDVPTLSPRTSDSQQSPRQQQQLVLLPLSPGFSAGPFLERTLSGTSSAGSTPRSASMRRGASIINTTRKGPSLDLTVSSAAVARSLQMQYVDAQSTAAAAAAVAPASAGLTEGAHAAGNGAAATAPPELRPLSASCALLCEQHCKKLQDIHGDLGETTALDIGCDTGGLCFELALSFSHVLGLDGDPLHVVAAKEMKERGQVRVWLGPSGSVQEGRPYCGMLWLRLQRQECFQLEYHACLDDSRSNSSVSTAAAAAASSSFGTAVRRLSEAGEELQHGVTRAAKVSDDIDRDKVRFWNYALPELPPKLQPVDAVLVEDVEGRLGTGLARVLEQVPGLLKPEGVCVVVLDDSGSSSGSAACAAGVADAADVAVEHSGGSAHVARMQQVGRQLEQQGLRFLKEQQLRYPLAGGSCGLARAGIWLQS